MANRPAVWKRISINDGCTSIIDCVNKTAPAVDVPTPYKMLRTTNIKKGRIDVENVKYVTEDTYKKWTRRQVPQKGDIILTREAPLGEVGMVRSDDKVFLGQRLVAYRTNPTVLDNKFLFYAFLAHDLQSQIRSLGSGSTVEHMRVPDAEKLTVLAPESVEAQREISSILSTYDDLIENNERRIKILEEMASRLYTEWFIKFKFPGHENIRLIDSGTEYGKIPEEWEVKKLVEVVDVNPKERVSTGSTILHIPMEALSNDSCVINVEKTERRHKVSGPRFKNGDTLFARITPCLQNGKTGLVQMLDENEIGCGSTEFVVLRSKALNPVFVYFLARSNSFRETAILTMVGASGRQRVVPEFFERYAVPQPSKGLLEKYAFFADPFFKEISRLSRKNIALSKTRDLLIPQLITGKRELKH